MAPSPDQVRDQLDRILVSDAFATAGRVSRLLKYVVDRTLAGEGEQLKEYVLGIEVFDRNDQYDPRLDSIVRVEARRLRAKLDEYYKGPGAQDPVLITIPRGSYTPLFELPERSTASAPAADVAPRPASVSSRRWWRVAAIAAVLATLAFIGRLALSELTGSEASTGVRIAVLPFAHFSGDAEVARIAARITDGVTSGLARAPTLSVVSRTSAAQFASNEKPVREVASALDAEFVMEGSVVVEAGGVHVIARLVNSAVDRKVWVGEYDSSPDQITDLSRRIAVEAASAVTKIRSGQ